jgi:hypothetical protein
LMRDLGTCRVMARQDAVVGARHAVPLQEVWWPNETFGTTLASPCQVATIGFSAENVEAGND